jgi:hypothetical protein
MTFEYRLPKRGRALAAFRPRPASETVGRPPRVARLVALAHKLEALLHSGQGKDYAELARQSHVSPARIAQILIFAQLAPEIQEYVLFLRPEHAGLITERQLRAIAREPRWDRQREQFQRLLGRGR